jgi:hypothetical protein
MAFANNRTGSPIRGTITEHAMNNKTQEFVIRIYDNAHAALWAALLAFVLYFAVVVAPHLPEAHARAESQRIHEIEAEHEFYCEKLGMAEGTPGHRQCVLDLQAFRTKVEQRMSDDLQDLF